MSKKSLKINFFYNLLYQILSIFLPIITTPYVSRILGAENIGIYGYTQSISAYFILFGSLGISLYGQRQIAYCQNNKKKYSKTFFEVLLLRLITMSLSLVLYYIFFICRTNKYNIYYAILSLELISTCFDISWFFQGMEEFKKTIGRNMLVRIIGLACTFIFVRDKNDLIAYLLIYVLSIVFGNLSLWIYVPKYILKTDRKILNFKQHIKPAILLFIPQIAIQIYTVLDKTMIGMIITNKSEVGYYTQGQKIINLLITVVTAMGTVMLPRIASRFAERKKSSIINYIEKSYMLVYLIAFPMLFGVLLVANQFVPIFFGNGYDKVCIIMKILSPLILIIGMGHVSGIQYLIPTNKQNIFTKCVCFGAIINFILNICFIKKLGAIGASISTLIAECTVTFSELIYIRKDFDIKKIIVSSKDFIISSIIMYIMCYLLSFIRLSNFYNLIVTVFSGTITYTVMLILLKNDFVMNIVEHLRRKIKKQLYM